MKVRLTPSHQSLLKYLKLSLALVAVVLFVQFIDNPTSAGFGTWTTNGPQGSPAIRALAGDPNNRNLIYAASLSSVYKSVDGGASWTAGNGFGVGDYNGLALARSNPNVVYATGGGTVYRSSDGGSTWTLTGLADNFGGVAFSRHGLAVDPTNENVVYVGTTRTDNLACEVWKSTNGGATWQPTGLPVSSAIALVIAPNNPSVIYAGMFNDVAEGVYKTVNGGASWSPTNMPGHRVWAIAVDPNNSNIVYAGASSPTATDGIYKTINGGSSWTLINNNLPVSKVQAIAIDPSNSSVVYLGTVTSSASVFRSTDGGASWQDFRTNGLPPSLSALIIDQTGKFIHAGSSAGVYDYDGSPLSPTTFVVTNTNDSGAGSLRQAMLDANGNNGTDTISFNIPGGGVRTIRPGSGLPAISDPVLIDGYTQPGASPNTLAAGSNAVMLIELDGTNAGSGAVGLSINAGGSTVRGLVINRFPSNGISLQIAPGNVVEGNFIGTDANGTVDLGNISSGVVITNSANNRIGGSAPAQRNVISGNNSRGINVSGTTATGTVIQGNYIGTDKNGVAALGNTLQGVFINGLNSIIGGTSAAAGNLISGNGSTGLEINGTAATGNVVTANLVGTNAAGTAAVPNAASGVQINNSSLNIIGGTSAAERNTISGNSTSGVVLNANANSNTVQGNFIGTDINGTVDLGNVAHGVLISASDNNLIGGTVAGKRNVISGNNGDGINMSGGNGTLLQGNFIGTQANGSSGLANSGRGITVNGSSNSTIGGIGAGAGNTIANNGSDGVGVLAGATNRISSNSIFANGTTAAHLGIDLGNDGVTANDTGDPDGGANALQNFPVLTSAMTTGTTTTFGVTFNSSANSQFTLEFYSNLTCDTSGNGEGRAFVGSTIVSIGASGNASFPSTLPSSIAIGRFATATATDSNGNTSEFSACRQVTSNVSISGRVLDDSGAALAGITLTLTGGASANTTTDANGNFSFANLATGGNYTVTPTSASYSFSPASQTFNSLNVDRVANFVGTQTVVNIAGTVIDSNSVGMNNVTVALTRNGVATGTTQTNALGNYSFGNLAAGANYVVTPAGSFTPSSQAFTNLTVNVTANFKGAPGIPSQCNTASFAAATNFAVGSLPFYLAIGDFNGDGKSDLAVANMNSNNVSILLGSGTGSFSAATNFAVGSFPGFVAVGDFNGDGKSDLVVANQNSADISILIGSGTGSFSAATNFAVGSQPTSVAIGDFNGDGNSDLAVTNNNSDNVSILVGSGTGSFGAATNFAVGVNPSSVTIGDFNSDGKGDLAVANANSSNVSILLSLGTGSFTVATNFAVGLGSNSVAIGDFNGDSKSDLAVANSTSANVSILLGTGTGSFSAATNFAAGQARSLAIGDFNGDGKSDLAVGNAASGNVVSILLGSGAGSFGAATNFVVGFSPLSVAIGDLNGDGKSDLAVANLDSNNVSILLNDSATCNTQTSLTIAGQITGASSNPLSNTTVTLSGPISRVVASNASGNYSFPNLAPGGNYAVTVQSPYYVFAPSRADFFNLGSNQTVNFTAAPVAVPAPTPLSDDFNTPVRDATKWNLGTQTQPAAAVDPQVTTAQINNQLVITPVNQASGLHYNGYVAANSFDIRNGKVGVEVVKAASGGGDTIFAIGSDSNNFFRFLVHTLGAPTSLAPLAKNVHVIIEPLDTTSSQLVFQVKINGQLTSLSINYDPVAHKFMRFRNETPVVSPDNGAILFETSPNNIDFTVQHKVLLDKNVSPMTAELSAGTSNPTTAGQAVFDNFSLTTTTYQFSAGSYGVTEGAGSILITVTRLGSVAETGSVDYSMADGTAIQGTKYVNASGKLTFAVGEASKTFAVSVVDNTLAEGNQTVNLLLGNPVSGGFNSPGRAVLNIVDNDTEAGPQFSVAAFTVSESGGSAQVVVNRHDTTAAVAVNYTTSDTAGLSECNVVAGKASSRCDYATSQGTLQFAVGEGSKTIFIPVVDDVYAEGNETFTVTLSNAVGATLGTQTTATITIQDNEPANGINPIDGVDFFVRQNYIDFLGREPDPAGLAGWRNVLVNCGITIQPPCDRIEVSAGFFRSEEFQSRGYFIYRFYSAVGRIPVSEDFMADFAKVSGFLTPQQLEANKVAYVDEFMARTEFQAKYGAVLNNSTAYVEALLLTVGLPNHPSKAGWVAGLTNSTLTRAQVLRQLVESSEVYNKYYNEAFVIMQYFGYLRRTADASYLNWIQTMNTTGGDYRIMINGFMNSAEYRRRFGP